MRCVACNKVLTDEEIPIDIDFCKKCLVIIREDLETFEKQLLIKRELNEKS